MTDTWPLLFLSHADQFSKRLDGLQKGLRPCDENIRVEQALSGEIRLDWSNTAVVTFGLFDPALVLAKRRYEAHFISKLTDCDGENSETDSSLDFAKDCCYITADQHDELTCLSQEIGKMLGSMIKHPETFLITAR